jgi:hypothetical protein
MWTFADEAEGASKAQNLTESKARLEALGDLIPGIEGFEVAIAQDGLEHSHDQILISAFDSVQTLKAYATHPAHLEYVAWLTPRRTGRVVIDYEV